MPSAALGASMHFTTRADLWYLIGPAEGAFGPLKLQVTKLPELSEAVREVNRPRGCRHQIEHPISLRRLPASLSEEGIGVTG